MLDSYIRNCKKKARESAQIICESRRRHPRFQVDRRAEIWKKIDAQEGAMKRMYDLVGDLPRMEGEFLSNQFEIVTYCYFTTGILKFTECFYVCRVYFLGHSANKLFAECCTKNTR